jgi:hypothetical protein
VRVTDYQNQKKATLKGRLKAKREHFDGESVTLQDIPLEIRRKEAKEPLFLIRYE